MTFPLSRQLDPTASHDHCIALPEAPGEIRWSPSKSLWFSVNAVVFGAFAASTFSWAGLAAATVTTGLCLSLGHSVGLHRGLIHRTFRMHRTTERVLAWLATLTGIGPVLRLMAMHDVRDTWQNRPFAPTYYCYDHGLWTDFWWYLHCEHVPQEGHHAPRIPEDHAADPVLAWLDRTWMLQQIPVALVLIALFGWSGLVWATCGRIVVSQVGHWLVNYLCHTQGSRRFAIEGAGEEGRNHWLFGALSMGEGWHNNHHAWPDSARFGMTWREPDPGFACIRVMERLGLASDVQTHDNVPVRPTARRLSGNEQVTSKVVEDRVPGR